MLCWFLFASLGRVVGSHESFHNDIDDPDPTLLISSLLTRDLVDTILCQSYDREYDQISSRGDTISTLRLLSATRFHIFLSSL